jgi:phosphate-selective porin
MPGRAARLVCVRLCATCVLLIGAAQQAGAQAEPPTPLRIGPVTVGGYVQADAIFTVDDDLDAVTVPADTFTIARARANLSGDITPKLTWMLQADLANFSSDARVLRDAYLGYAHNDAVAVRVGQFVAPFSLERLTSTSRLEVIDRSVIGTSLAASRDFGVMVFSPKPIAGWLTYAGAVINGAGQNHADDNDAKDFVGRVGVLVPRLKGVTVGVHGQRGEQPSGRRTRAGLDVQYEDGPFRAAVEVVQQTLDYARRRETSGYSVLGAYHHKAARRSPHYAGFELALRYVDVDDDGFTLAQKVLQFGGSYYVTPQVRIQSNLVVPTTDEQPRHARRWWSRVQFVF